MLCSGHGVGTGRDGENHVTQIHIGEFYTIIIAGKFRGHKLTQKDC